MRYRIVLVALFMALGMAGAPLGSAENRGSRPLFAWAAASEGLGISRGGWYEARVRQLQRGDYTMHVTDRFAFMNFHLVGPGVDRHTTLRFTGVTTWRIRLRPGVYRYYSDAWQAVRRHRFVVY
jgi:hypothetical protein